VPSYYSPPAFSPIEEALSKFEALLRRAGARTKEALFEAVGRVLDAVRLKDAKNVWRVRILDLLAES
jgi:hypothetical protein